MRREKRIAMASMIIVAFGLAFFFVAVPHFRPRPRTENNHGANCGRNLRLLGLGILGHVYQNGEFPRGTIIEGLPPEAGTSWICACGPSLDRQEFDRIDRSKRWDEPPNSQDARIPIREATCPLLEQTTTPEGFAITSYVGISGVGPDAASLPAGHPRAGIFGDTRVTRLADLKDGSSQTMMLADTTRNNGCWLAGGTNTIRLIDPAQRPYIGENRPFGGLHKGGANIALADGSVRWIPDTIAPRVFEAIATISGGEPIAKADLEF